MMLKRLVTGFYDLKIKFVVLIETESSHYSKGQSSVGVTHSFNVTCNILLMA